LIDQITTTKKMTSPSPINTAIAGIEAVPNSVMQIPWVAYEPSDHRITRARATFASGGT
jgi:hypothetical protein